MEEERKIRKGLAEKGLTAKYSFSDILGKSKAIRENIHMAQRYSRVNSNVLIVGETGTGKELFAHSIHQASSRSDQPFVALNCAAPVSYTHLAVSEAARKNLPVAAHCIGGQGLKDCIDGGVQVIEHMYMCTPQDAEWLTNSKCIVDFTSGIFLDPTREETLSANNAYRVRKNRTRVRERLKLLMSTGVPYVLGTDAYHGYLYREVGYARCV